MAYRRASRTRRSSGSTARNAGARRRGKSYPRQTKARSRAAPRKRRAPAKGLTSKQRTQVLRIVLTHETPNAVQRPAGEGSVITATPKKSRF
jgi:hypothetical protein